MEKVKVSGKCVQCERPVETEVEEPKKRFTEVRVKCEDCGANTLIKYVDTFKPE